MRMPWLTGTVERDQSTSLSWWFELENSLWGFRLIWLQAAKSCQCWPPEAGNFEMTLTDVCPYQRKSWYLSLECSVVQMRLLRGSRLSSDFETLLITWDSSIMFEPDCDNHFENGEKYRQHREFREFSRILSDHGDEWIWESLGTIASKLNWVMLNFQVRGLTWLVEDHLERAKFHIIEAVSMAEQSKMVSAANNRRLFSFQGMM